MKGRPFERVRCPFCHRQVSGYVPAGSDGTTLRLTQHRVTEGPGVAIFCPHSGHLIARPNATARGSKGDLLEVADQLLIVREALLTYQTGMEADDPNRVPIDQARVYLEAAAGRLRSAV